ncbi:hypothetical protein D9M71_277800 [compost metagenome]
MLGDLRNMATQVAQAIVLDLHAIEQDLPLVVVIEAWNQGRQGRLATAGAADQGDHLPGLGDKTDVAQHFTLGTRVSEAQVAHFQAPFHALLLDRTSVHFRRFVQLLEDAFGTCQALLDGRADFRQLTNRLGQQAGSGDISHQVTGSGLTAQEQYQEHQRSHGAVDHQLKHRRVQRAGLGHAQLLVGVALAGLAESLLFVGLATEATDHAVTLDGFRGNVGDIAHGHLDLLALLAEFLAGTADHDCDQRQDRQHHQGQFPVHPQQVGEQEHHGQAFADHHLDRIGGGTSDHGHVEGDARNQVPGIVVVEIAVRQYQQLVEQLHTQVVHQAQGNLGQEVVAEERAQALPRGDQDDQQRHRLQQLQVTQVGDVGEQYRFGVAQPIDEVLENAGQHWLGRGKDHETDNAQQENADIGFHIAQQPEVDLQAGGVLRWSRCFGHYRARCSG